MNQEIIAVVDENDQFINNQPRSKVHQFGLRHRAVHILLFNNKQQLFLQKRSSSKDVNAGLWDTSVAGHVNAGEDYIACARRETIEELGIHQFTLKFLFKLPAIPKTGMEFVQVYSSLHNGPFTLERKEIERGQWFDIKGISQRVSDDDLNLTDTFKILWLKFTE